LTVLDLLDTLPEFCGEFQSADSGVLAYQTEGIGYEIAEKRSNFENRPVAPTDVSPSAGASAARHVPNNLNVSTHATDTYAVEEEDSQDHAHFNKIATRRRRMRPTSTYFARLKQHFADSWVRLWRRGPLAGKLLIGLSLRA
jgi:hypothetical protein